MTELWQTFLGALETLTNIRPLFAVAAISLYSISVILAGARWKKVLEGLGCSSRLTQTSLGVLIGIFVNNVTPSSRLGGEVSRVALISKWAKVDLKRATVSIFYDRLVMLVPFSLMILLALPILRRFVGHLRGPMIFILPLTLLGLILFIITMRVERLREWVRGRIAIVQSFRIDRQSLLAAIGFSTLIWILDMIRLTVVVAAFGVILNPYQAATLSVVILLCSFIPSLGGLGPTEGGLTAALHLFGIGFETAIAITLLERAISYVLSTGAGSIALAAIGGRRLLLRPEPSSS